MKIAVIGGGYVGLVMAAGLAELGHAVVCAERDSEKLKVLKSGISPIHETGLTELLVECMQHETLTFVSQVAEAIKAAELIFIAVGTPSATDGSADISAVKSVAIAIGKSLSTSTVVAVKSTVPVGTCSAVEQIIRQEIAERNVSITCEVVSNPEFLKEGDALKDFRRPDRIVIGSISETATDVLRRAYAPFVRNHDRLVIVDRESAELGKYASNAMLATRISFMNELSAISEQTGADIEQVRAVMGSDSRIGPDFLYAGPGFGGSCFPKDISALINTGASVNVSTSLLDAVLSVNERQKDILCNKTASLFESLNGKTITIWGISFKPNTDDIREAPALRLIEFLINCGAKVRAYDPVVKSINSIIDNQISFCDDKYDAANGSDLLILVTEWKTFRSPDFFLLKKIMRTQNLIDGRNIWNREDAETRGFSYQGIGR
jgi:UDPglucose 6-dehydrogenase